MKQNNEFRKIVGILLSEYQKTIKEISTKLSIDEKEFYQYYSGYQEVTQEIMEKLNKYVETSKKEINEFKKLADQIEDRYEMTHREIAAKIGITEVSFSRYYDGTRGATDEEMDNLRKLNENEKFTVVKVKYNRFKYLVDILTNKYKMSKKEIMNELMIDDMSFISYYDGDKEATNEMINKLSKLEKEQENKEQENNEFRKTVKEIEEKCFMTRREMARRIGITEVSFFRFFDGAREATEEAMNSLKELSENVTKNKKIKPEAEKINMNNEFRKLVDEIQKKYQITDAQIAKKVGLDGLFDIFYYGIHEVDEEIIKNLQELLNNRDFDAHMPKSCEFKKLTDMIKTRYHLSLKEIGERIGVKEIDFIDYYNEIEEATPRMIDKLVELFNDKNYGIQEGKNEFKKLVDELYEKHKMIHREVAAKIGISDFNFHYCYEGFKKPSQDSIDKLRNLLKIKNNESEPDIIEELNKRHYVNPKNQYEFSEIVHRLSKLSKEHKKEVYDLINSYSEEENKAKKLTPENKD